MSGEPDRDPFHDHEEAVLYTLIHRPEIPIPTFRYGALSASAAAILSAIAKARSEGAVADGMAVRALLRSDRDASMLAVLMDGGLRWPSVDWHVKRLNERAKRSELGHHAQALADELAEEHGAASSRVEELLEAIHELGKPLNGESHVLHRITPRDALENVQHEIPWVLDGWLAEGDIVLLAGEGGAGKSVLALDLALGIASGQPVLGRRPREAQAVLIIDEENPTPLASYRFGQLLRGRGLGPDVPLEVLSQNGFMLSRPEGVEALLAELARRNVRWVVLDSLVRFHTADENDNAQMARFFAGSIRRIKRETGVGFLILHHLAKPSKERTKLSDRMRGASDIRNFVDAAWGLEGDQNSTTRTLTCDKLRWQAARPKPIQTEWVEQDQSATLTYRTASVADEQLILDALEAAGASGIRHGDATQALDPDASERASKSATRTLKNLVHRRLACKIDKSYIQTAYCTGCPTCR